MAKNTVENIRLSGGMYMLRKAIKANGYTIECAARKTGINPATFYRKVASDGDGFKVCEVKRMIREGIISRADAIEIFLPQT